MLKKKEAMNLKTSKEGYGGVLGGRNDVILKISKMKKTLRIEELS